MSYQEEGPVRLRRQRSKQAIALAMQGRWKEAIEANKSIIESFPNDIAAYNRLGRACMEVGDYAQAKAAYSQAVELDPYNTIATKNLQRLSRLGEARVGAATDSDQVEPQHFIEEIGKAGVVNLYHLAPAEVLARMVAGDRVYLKIDSSSLVVASGRGEYLGQVEPRHAQRLIKLMEGGNLYSAAIVSSTEDMVTVIIKEVYQHPDQAGQLSFPSKGFKEAPPYVSDKILRRELEREEELEGEPGYTIIGGEEPEVLTVESAEGNDTADEEE